MHNARKRMALQALFGALLGCVTLLPSLRAVADDARDIDFVENARSAKAVLINAVQSRPQLQAGLGLSSFEISFRGTDRDLLQSFSPENNSDEQPISYEVVADLAQRKTQAHVVQTVNGGVVLDFGAIIAPTGSYRYNLFAKWIFQDPSLGSILKLLVSNTLPALVVRDALSRPGSLRYAGAEREEGRDADVIEFTTIEGLRSKLALDKEDGRLRRMQLILPSPITGEQLITYQYIGEQTVGGVGFPESVRIEFGSPALRTIEVNLDVRSVNESIESSVFEPPQNFETIQTPPFTGEFLSKNLLVIKGLGSPLYRAVFLVTEEGLIAFDAPISPGVAARAAAKARELTGGKTVTHVVLSHFHNDHMGGVAGYLASRPKILATPDTAPFIEQMPANRLSLFGPPGQQPLDIDIEVVEKSTNITLGGVTFQVLDLGPTPHVKQLLAIYDPRDGLLVDADTYSADVDWADPAQHYADWVEKTSLEIDHMIGIHHDLLTPSELLELAGANR